MRVIIKPTTIGSLGLMANVIVQSTDSPTPTPSLQAFRMPNWADDDYWDDKLVSAHDNEPVGVPGSSENAEVAGQAATGEESPPQVRPALLLMAASVQCLRTTSRY